MTKLIRFSPVSDVPRLQNEIDRLFSGFFPAMRPASEEAETAVLSPRLDLIENDSAYTVRLDVPGMSKDDLNINFHDGVLSVSGERQMEEMNDKDNCVRLERSFGRFYRSFNLPMAIDETKIGAKYEQGVLTVTVPKSEASKPRQIKIS